MIENLRNKFVENPESLRDYYNDLDKLIESKKDLNVFITYDKSFIDQQVEKLIEKAKNNEKLGKMYGVAVSVKDNINIKDLKMTCGSKMLEDYVSIYDATVIKKLKEEDCIIVGKVNMDEFAMGSSSETSYFGPTKNPVDTKLIPGGSSSGSAASIKAEMAVVSLGTDTGGSSRQPASCCNVVGFMPTYGSISRFGVQSMANTLDEVGILSNSV
ncbi:MAG: amidase family protein, partial [Finegoldia magna]|nr:amidase family protein [Finegoldia magna]